MTAIYSSDEKTIYPAGFDQTMTEQAEVLFDWSRERDPKTKENKIKNVVATLHKILDKKKLLVRNYFFVV